MMTILLSLALAAAGTADTADRPATEQTAKPAKPKKVCERIESTGSSVPKKVCRTVKAPTVETGTVEAAAEKPAGNSTN
ncbi:hypothetical protein [Sphingopyxis sp. KK2]|uniref:hypothetical protein n=1 Tax=Sphingopyxis sp. KK2 TaxID=1855727 RepID=UPI00097E6E27|nr:hypothetical protein [Sphingopyxis sp. KK2]